MLATGGHRPSRVNSLGYDPARSSAPEEPAMQRSDHPLVITLWETYGSNMEPVAARVGEILGT